MRQYSCIFLKFSGANDTVLNKMKRGVHRGLCALRHLIKNKKLVSGNGAVEVALNVRLEGFATSTVIELILILQQQIK